jgi:hypothetical protein
LIHAKALGKLMLLNALFWKVESLIESKPAAW